jgi:hypothetical protein
MQPGAVRVVGLRAAGDIPGALSASVERGGLILDEKDVAAEFFDLKTGLAGEVLKKFTLHRARLAIVVADASVYGGGFRELAYEHRTHNAVRFFSSEKLARQWLVHNPVAKC